MNLSNGINSSNHVIFNPNHFEDRATDSIKILKPYSAELQITITGTGFSCNPPPGPFFTSAVLQQGRIRCDNDYGLCSGASKCPLTDETDQGTDTTTCTFTCLCPPATGTNERPCGKVLFAFGEGMRRRGGDAFAIHGIRVNWIRND